MDLSLFTAASQSVSVLKTLFDSVVATRDASKAVEFVNALQTAQSQIFGLQAQAAALMQSKYELEAKVRDLEAAARKRENLELYEVRSGAFVYAAKPPVGESHEPPYFCQACYGQGIEAILQLRESQYSTSWDCPIKAQHNIGIEQRDIPPKARRGSGGPFIG